MGSRNLLSHRLRPGPTRPIARHVRRRTHTGDRPAKHSKMILIIEDERVIADVLCSVLEDEGYRVLVADNGREGLSSLEVERPHLVLCDLMMPGLDGREVSRVMASHPRYRSIPFIMMSAGHSMPSGPGVRYDAFLRKPFDLDQLIALVAEFVS